MKAFQIIILTLAIFILSTSPILAQSLTLDHVDGTINDSLLAVNIPITFYVRAATGPDTIQAMEIFFQVYSPDGASWREFSADIVPIVNPTWLESFDMVAYAAGYNPDGISPDTVRFGGVRGFTGDGLPPDFDQVIFKVTIGSMLPEDSGKTICIDSVTTIEGLGYWRWVLNNGDKIYPSWDGPYCFEIFGCDGVDSDGDLIPDPCDICPNAYNPDQTDSDGNGTGDACCCIGMRGNIDEDLDNIIDVVDLVYFVDFQFRNGSAPACFDAADLVVDGVHDVADLVFMVDYQFRDGDAPPACP